jgi:hypothetical protein
MPELSSAAACANCHAPMSGAYCVQCGQKRFAGQTTLRNMAGDAVVQLTQLESGLFRTLWGLLVRPGDTARAFVAGQRRRYTHPFVLLLLMATVYFLVTAVFSDSQWQEFHRFLQTDRVHWMTATQRDRFLHFYQLLRSYLPYSLLLATLPGAALLRLSLPTTRHTVAEVWLVTVYAASMALLLISLLAAAFLAFSIPTIALSMAGNFIILVAQIYYLQRYLGGGALVFARIVVTTGLCFAGMLWLQYDVALRYALWSS